MTEARGSAAPARIDKDVVKSITRQSYGGNSAIEGVKVITLERHVEEGGELAELVRIGARGEVRAFPGFELRQLNFSSLEPGQVKAWHIHERQTDIWFVPPTDRILIGLFDVRQDSPTRGASRRLTLGAGRASLVLIPPGVAHGSANVARTTGFVLYLHDNEFNLENPDELRLPWDHLGSDFWTLRRG